MDSTPSPPPPRSDAAESEALFANEIDLETADKTTVQRYIFQQYTGRNIEDRRLWDGIQANFGDFQEKHFKMLDGPSWDLIKTYCYTHGYWLDHNYSPGESRATIMLKAVNADWYDNLQSDQLRGKELQRLVSTYVQTQTGTLRALSILLLHRRHHLHLELDDLDRLNLSYHNLVYLRSDCSSDSTSLQISKPKTLDLGTTIKPLCLLSTLNRSP